MSSKYSAPLGTNLSRAYRALLERKNNDSNSKFAQMAKGFDVRGSSWTHHDLAYIAKGAPVIWFPGGFVGTGPFEAISDGITSKNVDGGFYATVYVPPGTIQIISEREFYTLFMRPWSWWRRTRWNLMGHWT